MHINFFRMLNRDLTGFVNVRFVVVVLLLLSYTVKAQGVDAASSEQPFKISPPLATEPLSKDMYIPLNDISTDKEQWELFFGKQLIVRNIESAGLYVYSPKQGKANGRAVIVLPGGGYQFVSMANEGSLVANRLVSEGYTVFVLKYRTKATPRDGKEFLSATAPAFMSLGKSRLAPFKPAQEDLFSAMSFLKKDCESLGCDASKISLLGFSAGARTVMGALQNGLDMNGIESLALMYPPTIDRIESNASRPLFIGIAADDPLFLQGGFTLPSDWLQRSPDLEFHLYSGGRHGFGMAASGTTSQFWIDQYLTWLDLHVRE